MKNAVIDQQIMNAIMFNRTFLLNCKAAAFHDDKQIDHEEEKALKIIETAVNKYIAALQKVN